MNIFKTPEGYLFSNKALFYLFIPLLIEQSLEFISDDELVEITPENIRIRKKILDPTMRIRAKNNG